MKEPEVAPPVEVATNAPLKVLWDNGHGFSTYWVRGTPNGRHTFLHLRDYEFNENGEPVLVPATR